MVRLLGVDGKLWIHRRAYATDHEATHRTSRRAGQCHSLERGTVQAIQADWCLWSCCRDDTRLAYSCTTRGGITEYGKVFRWRVQFSGVETDELVGYLHLGVLFSDELGLLEKNPQTTTVPCIARESTSRLYDVIVNTRCHDWGFHIVDVPGNYIYHGSLRHRAPDSDCPLLLVVWSKHRCQITLTEFESHSNREVGEILPRCPPRKKTPFSYTYATV